MSDAELDASIGKLHTGFMMSAPIYKVEESRHIFRAVSVTEKPTHVARVSYPPPEKAPQGRFNRPQEPLFYGSLGQFNSCLLECRCEPNNVFAVSSWRLTKDILLNHLGYSAAALEALKTKRELPNWAIIKNDTEHNKILRLWQGRVVTKVIPTGQEHLYRLGCSLYRFSTPKFEQIDPNAPKFFGGIIYPSVATWMIFDNVALFPSTVDTSLSIEEVVLVRLESIDERPLPNKGKEWRYRLRVLDIALSDQSGNLIWGQRNSQAIGNPNSLGLWTEEQMLQKDAADSVHSK